MSFDLVLAADRDPTAPHSCDAAFSRGNANDDGRIDIADAIAALAYLFASARPLPPPFGAYGQDGTPDDLNCASFAACR